MFPLSQAPIPKKSITFDQGARVLYNKWNIKGRREKDSFILWEEMTHSATYQSKQRAPHQMALTKKGEEEGEEEEGKKDDVNKKRKKEM